MQLVIAEKPSVAKSIADVLGALDRQDGYFEGGGYLVSWCVGHLIELAEPESYGEQWKKWTYESLPVNPEHWQYEIKEDTKEQYDVLYGLLHDSRVDEVVCATDAGREGELIFRLVYNMASCKKPMKRLWISSMEESAIREGVENLKPGSDYDHLYHSALCRQEADWLVGINGTRLFTVLYGGKVLKVGRVQTPTLAMLVEREAKIMNFKKEQYFMAHILCGGVDAVTERIDNKTEAENVAGACRNGQALVTSVEKEEKTVSPPKLYDLTTLQRDANRLFGFTAKQTLEYTQSLYEKKMCTYPRTDSQYLSDDMEQTAGNVIEAIFSSILFEENRMFNPDIKRVLNSKKVTDHHAIIPTENIGNAVNMELTSDEKQILHLVIRRVLEALSAQYEYMDIEYVFDICGETFKLKQKKPVNLGWKALCPDDVEIPPEINCSENDTFYAEDIFVTEGETKPPKRYTESSLLKAMENIDRRIEDKELSGYVSERGLGTPATRTAIIEKILADGYAERKNKVISATEMGIKMINFIPPEIKSVEMTAAMELQLAAIENGPRQR